MTVTFKRNNKAFTGTVLSRGFYNVDIPEGYEVELCETRTVWVPVTECRVI